MRKMRKPSMKKLYRLKNTLDDGRQLYLSTHGKVVAMPRREADFWIGISRRVHSITIDEMVYSKDLQFYGRRSFFLERLAPFVRVVRTTPERADVAVDPKAFIIGDILAAGVDHHIWSEHAYGSAVVIIC